MRTSAIQLPKFSASSVQGEIGVKAVACKRASQAC